MNREPATDVWMPLSSAQRSRWFLYRLAPRAQGGHNNVFAAVVHGDIDAETLSHALRRLTARHPLLRACFRERDGEPEQRMAGPIDVPLICLDASALDDAALRERIDSDGSRAFDLSRGPLIRAGLYARGAHEHVLLIAFDHIAVDGWSYWQLLDELGDLLAHPAQSDAPASGPDESYASYVEWQATWLETPAAAAQRAYWEQCLTDAPPVLQLPADRPLSTPPGARDEVTLTLPADLTRRLRDLTMRHAGTLYTTLLSSYQILLHRHTGQHDIAIGSPMPGRTRPAWDRVIGDFVNPIVLRARLDGEMRTADVLRDARRVALRGMANQDYPFDLLVRDFHAARDTGQHPFYQTMFVFQHARRGAGLRALWDDAQPGRRTAWGGLELTPYPAWQSGGNDAIRLLLEAIELEDGIRCAFRFDGAVFDRPTIERLAGHWHNLLEGMVADDAQAIARLPLLSAQERRLLLEQFNDTQADYPHDRPIQALFEAQARRQPDADAVAYEEQVLSYAELNRRANRVAHRLLALGVRPDDRVALYTDRGLAMVIGLLGILKAGGAYVPLDPAYPANRLAYMLADSAPVAVVTESALLAGESLPGVPETMPVLVVDALDDEAVMSGAPAFVPAPMAMPALMPEHNPVVEGITTRHLAYVIYTSGSTGQPKGVMVEHRSVLNLWSALEREAFATCAADGRIGLNAALSFDASVQSLAQLLSGRCIVIVPSSVRADGDAMVRFLIQQRIEALDCTPAQFDLLISHGLFDRAAPSRLRAILIGGEALPARAWDAAAASPVRCFNVYGPTECTVDATLAHITPGAPPHVGRPLANTRVYVLDGQGEPAPIGVIGEIHIAGAGVARGYWNRPDLTSERFVRDPFAGDADARMYKTGDLGRWRPDGTIEYLGRRDFQVKIRGHRIELGEIEATLAACDGVREAVVIAREDAPGDRRLVAYVVPRDGVELSAGALRERLARELAEYMIPAAFVSLAALPLTPNGKVDRAALPAPDQSAVVSRAYEAPAGEIEQVLASIWQTLLRVDRVGRHDHFFELGGHSLLAVQLSARLRDALGVELALREVFALLRLADMAQSVRDARAAALPPILPCDRRAPLPLSWAQQRLWFLDRLGDASSAAYHMPAAMRLKGRLDRDALQAALDRVVARHETLRTTLVSVDDAPRQVIAPEDSGFTLLAHDLRELDEGARAAALADLSAREACAPFDLSTGPLIRGRLLRLAEDEHVLLVTQHHIASDAWSIGVLIREVSALYAAFSRREPDPLPPLPIQYADYAVWQRQWLQGDVLRDQLEFWRTHLSGAPALLELPTDRPRPAVQTYAGDRVPVRLPAELTQALRALSQRHGTTLFMTLLAGWSALLSRLSGQDDVVIGTPIANRQHLHLEPLIGFFVNTLALRTTLAADPTVADLLQQVKTTTLEAYAHQDLPFEQVVETLQPVRSLGHSPLFQALLTLNNTPAAGSLDLPGLTLSTIDASQKTTQFDVSLSLTEVDGRLDGTLEYASDLFDEETMARWAGHFETLLREMVTGAEERISALPLLQAHERQQLLQAFNATEADYPRTRTIHGLFEDQVQRHPEALALLHEHDSLTYAELNRRANQLAHRLIALGVRPDDRVAICTGRGPAMVIGVLGILKAGAAYVPMDPAYPVARLTYMLADCAPAALLTQRMLHATIEAWTRETTEPAAAGLANLPVLMVDEDEAQDETQGAAKDEARDADDARTSQTGHNPLVPGLTSKHLAYVIYTSGSTGQPKGVMIEHASTVNLLAWAAASFSGAQISTTVLSTSLTFDLAVFELFVPLTRGATVRLVQDLVSAGAWLEGATLVNTVPSAIAAVVDQARLPPTVTTVNLAGEPLKRSLVDRVFASSDAQVIANLYGPTETTTYSTWIAMTRASGFVSHIGRPVANTRVYVLDGRREPAPLGVIGEIHIGGAGVARGYLNRPALTAERFVHDPFAGDADARMYKTGDLGRWRPDGTIEYLGRRDFQVKIRGYRIELGEIETALLASDGVREAVVIAREDQPGDKRIVAYVVPHDGVELAVAALRARLSRELPEYMVPSAFVRLAALPLTPNGKLDRHALPAPDHLAVVSRAYEAPEGEIEQVLAALWQELLGAPRVGRHDHFFELGGHSLLAMQLVSRLRQALGVELALRELFAWPVLADMARAIHDERAAALPPILPVDRRAAPSLPLSWAQQRLWFLDQLGHAASAAYHMPLALRLDGRLDRTALQTALDRIVARHESLRTRFANVDGEPVQVIGPPDIGFALLHHDLQDIEPASQETAVQSLAASEAQAPFDLSRGPLVRGRLLRLADEAHVLLVTQHHIISDAWSIGVLAKEVNALYAAFSQGQADPLPPLPIQYADYAVWQRACLQDELLDTQTTYWRDRLTGAPALLPLPTDRPRPTMQRYAGSTLRFQLPTALTQDLRALSLRHGTTLFMTLLAGWSVLLSRLSGAADLVVGTTVANRQRAEIEPLLGFFVNTLAMRMDVSDDPSVTELLSRTKAATLGAYAHQDLPFEQVVDMLQPARSLGHNPIVQAMLVLQNAPGRDAPGLRGLTLTLLEPPRTTTQFDVSLSLVERDGRLDGTLEYASDLFDASTMARWAGHFETLLRGMASDAEQRVHALPLLSADERTQLLETFNATHTGSPRDCTVTVHRLFEDQTARTPNAVALVCGDESLTYAELNWRANRLAHRLLALGVRPDDRVAICAGRSVAMVAGMLAVLKAGGAYVPLDPAQPAARMSSMLTDSAPAAVLMPRALRQTLTMQALDAGFASLPVLLLDEDEDEGASVRVKAGDAVAEPRGLQAVHNPVVPALTPNHLAYVIYTSGSTGRPKGVMAPHSGIVNYVTHAAQAYLPPEVDGAIVATPFGFDATVTTLMTPWLAGKPVVLLPEDPGDCLAQLLVYAQKPRPWLFKLTPAHLDALAHLATEPPASTRHVVVVGGEQLTRHCVTRFRECVLPDAIVVNEYGPTETVVGCTIFVSDGRDDVPDAAADAGGAVPIGAPIANSRIYILDAHRQPAPLGVAGELYIGGVQVTRGYLNQPDLTPERFLPDPFVTDVGPRMYRSGDLARWRPDGNLEYLGRNDGQVKIRGFRIEPGEIEAQLSACDGVREAAVVVREDALGERRLVAYVSPQRSAKERALTGLAAEQVAQWSKVFDDQSREAPIDEAEPEPGFDLSGWNSSYTREPIPAEAMREWLDATLARLEDLHPRRVLEIGCGTGLILSGIAPRCERYVGTDLSARTVARLDRHIQRVPELARVASVFPSPANAVDIVDRDFDTVVLNSVAQYFPSLDYLEEVIASAITVMGDGGNLFIGDVRHYGLIEAFHLSVQLFQAADASPLPYLFERAAQKARAELELLVDPAWFHALRERHPQISGVRISPKIARHHTEMSAYRYDVVLSISAMPAGADNIDIDWLDWRGEPFDAASLQQRIDSSAHPIVGLRAIPHPWVTPYAKAWRQLARAKRTDTAAALKAQIASDARAGVLCDELAAFCRARDYSVDLSWLSGEDAGEYHALIGRHGQPLRFDWRSPRDERDTRQALQTSATDAWANDPLDARWRATLPGLLRERLMASVPDYMVPSAVVLLDALPLTPNGKVDRQALPAPDPLSSTTQAYEAPQGDVEMTIARIWQDLLGLECVGRHDHFFDVGGHSLLAVQLISHLRKAFGVELPVAEIFRSPHVDLLAKAVLVASVERFAHEDVERFASEIDQLSEEQLRALLEEERGAR
jgi:amino acid adenylation domain-containing protein